MFVHHFLNFNHPADLQDFFIFIKLTHCSLLIGCRYGNRGTRFCIIMYNFALLTYFQHNFNGLNSLIKTTICEA